MKAGNYDFKASYWLRSAKKDGNGLAPVVCKLKLNNEQTNIYTGFKIKPATWDGKRGRITGRSELVEQQNLMLSEQLNQIQFEFFRLAKEKERLTIKDLKQAFSGTDRHSIELVSIAAEYIEKIKTEKRRSTIQSLETHFRHLSDFLRFDSNQKIKADELDYRFMQRYVDFLIGRKKFKLSYVRAITIFVKTVVQYAYTYNKIDFNPIAGFVSPRFKYDDIVFLDEDDLEKLKNHRFASERLQLTADLFLIQCYTGFSYADLMNFSFEEYITKNKDGSLWVDYNRNKNGSNAQLPLLPDAERLLKKHHWHIEYLHNQCMNRYLKEIALILDLKVKNLSTHVGRKTFGSLCLNRGVSLEVVSKCMGHADTRVTAKHYAKLLNRFIAEEMQKMMQHRPGSDGGGMMKVV